MPSTDPHAFAQPEEMTTNYPTDLKVESLLDYRKKGMETSF